MVMHVNKSFKIYPGSSQVSIIWILPFEQSRKWKSRWPKNWNSLTCKM